MRALHNIIHEHITHYNTHGPYNKLNCALHCVSARVKYIQVCPITTDYSTKEMDIGREAREIERDREIEKDRERERGRQI